MKRVIAGIVIAPFFWPWIAASISMVYFRLYTGIGADYSFWVTPLHNLRMFWDAYILMLVLCPLMLLLLRRKPGQVGRFLILGAVVGFLAPVLLQVLGPLVLPASPDVIAYRSWAGFAEIAPRLALMNLHTTTGSAVATSAMLGIFWLIAVRGSRLFTGKVGDSLYAGARPRHSE